MPDWTWQAGSVASDMSGGLVLMPVAAGGAAYPSSSTDTGADRGAWLRKFSADGRRLWSVRLGPTAVDHIVVLRVHADGSLMIGGSVFGPFQGGAWQGQQDVFVARVDPQDGHVLQSWKFGSTESDWLTAGRQATPGRDEAQCVASLKTATDCTS